MIKSSVTQMTLSSLQDWQRADFFQKEGTGTCHQEDRRKGRGFTGDGFQSFE